MTVDTLSLARELKAAEVPSVQAEAIAAAIGRTASERMTSSATKADLAQAEARLEARMEALNAKLVTWFVGTQIAIGALVVALLKL